MKAVIATIPEQQLLGQAAGVIISLAGNTLLESIIKKSTALNSGWKHNRVAVNFVGNHEDVGNNCWSICCLFTPDNITTQSMERRTTAFATWLRNEFGVASIAHRSFSSREEFCNFMGTPLEVL